MYRGGEGSVDVRFRNQGQAFHEAVHRYDCRWSGCSNPMLGRSPA